MKATVAIYTVSFLNSNIKQIVNFTYKSENTKKQFALQSQYIWKAVLPGSRGCPEFAMYTRLTKTIKKYIKPTELCLLFLPSATILMLNYILNQRCLTTSIKP